MKSLSRRRFLAMTGIGVAGTTLLAACTQSTPPAAAPTAAPAKPAAPAAAPTTAPAKPAAAAPTAAPAKPAAAAPTTAPAVASKPAPAQPAAAAAGNPVKGGTLTFGVSKDLSNAHPFVQVSSVPQYLKETMYESLLDFDLNSDLQGLLAEKWDTSPDGRVWTFNLRKGVKFHDGKEMTSADVVWSANYVKNPENASFGAATMKVVEKIEAVDPYTVRMTLTSPSAAFGTTVASIRSFAVIPQGSLAPAVKKVDNNPPPGTGAFKWNEWKPNNEFSVVRHDGYWDGAPYLDKVVFKLIPDDTARFNALRAGDLQTAERIGVEFVKQIDDGKVQGIKTFPASLSGFRRLVWNHQTPAFQDIKMRQAVAYAIDKDALLEELFWGYATPAEIKMPPGSAWQKAANLPPRKQDLAKSRALLAEAGYKGQELIGIGRRGEHSEIWEALVNQLRKVGLNVKVEINESAVYDQRQQTGQFDMTLRGGATAEDPSESLKPDLYSEPGDQRFRNYSGHSNPELDKLFDKLEVTINQEERLKVFAQLAKVYQDDFVEYPLGYAGDRFFGVLDAKAKNFSPTTGGGYTHRFGGLKKTWMVG